MDGSSPSLSFDNFLKSPISIITVRMLARKSDTGKHIHTPSAPKNIGRKYRRGIRNRICLDSERIMDLWTIPRHWKKLVDTIWKPTIGKSIFIVLSPDDAIDLSTKSEVNMEHTASGKNTHTTKQEMVTIVA